MQPTVGVRRDGASSAFRDFELQGWQRSADTYSATFPRLTTNTIPEMLSQLGVRSGSRLLDVATGPGDLAGAAARLGASVIGVDFSIKMLGIARANFPAVQFEVGDAERLPFKDSQFDAVAINFGVLHFGEPEAALKEGNRVLVAGGRLSFSVWCQPTEAVGFAEVLDAVKEHGDCSVKLPDGPPFFKFSDKSFAVDTLSGIGFRDISVTKIPMFWHLKNPEEFFNAFYQGTARTGGLLRAQPANALAKIKSQILEAVTSKYVTVDGAVEVPMPALVYAGGR